jgi:hypothetical protein
MGSARGRAPLSELTAYRRLRQQKLDQVPLRVGQQGLIQRIEHTHTYALTPEGQRLAIFYTKLNDRLLRPLFAADQPQASPGLRRALAAIDGHIDDYITRARLKSTA